MCCIPPRHLPPQLLAELAVVEGFRLRQGFDGQAGAGRDSAALPKGQDTNDVYNFPLF